MNDSGLIPLEYKCVIQLKKVEEVSEGGIVMVKDTVQKEQWAETEAVLIAHGGNAFSDWDGDKPQSGDHIIIRKYSGQQTYDGADGGKYQFCNDKDICGIDKRQKDED